ncbi:MAG: response regulator, partial [Vulcanimicrobiaceae bacterium]
LRRAERRRYSLLLDSTREIVMFVDRETHQIIEVNTAALEAYGYKRDEMLALRVEDVRLPDYQREVEPLIERMADGLLLETTAVRKDGSTFPIELAIRPVELDGHAMILSVGRDVTERRNTMRDLSNALEKAQAAGKLKSEFVATVSHEIRTPLTGIIGMSELLQVTRLDDDQLDSVRTIHESSTALLKIINDILDFSKLEAGRGELETIDFNLSPLVEGVVQLMNRAVKRESVTLMTYVSPKVPAAFRGDPGRLRQILMNLVGNAVKFTERGFVVVSVDLVRTSNELAVLRFEVADTGIGMDEESRTKLFQPFQQADPSTARRFGGTGLGLAICKAYVEMMQGTIAVESAVNEGTTVTFDVVLEVAESRAARPDTTLLSQRRLLIVDGDDASRCMIEKYMSDWQMNVTAARGEDEAFDLLRKARDSEQPFDIAIVSLPLPGLRAFEFARRIKDDPRSGQTRLLLLASQRVEGGSARAEDYGFEAVLTKPITQSNLFDRLVTMLGGTPSASMPPSQLDAFCPLDRQLRVLVAEDNAVNQRVAQRQLQALGCESVVVDNGVDAIAALENGTFDVVLMDCNMPVMDGFDATIEIRKRQREGQIPRTRIIALTANASEDDRQRCLVAGMDGYLSKPILLGQLREALQNLTALI